MSTIEDKRNKLLQLRAQTRVKQNDKETRLNEIKSKRNAEGAGGESEFGTGRDDLLLSQDAKTVEPENKITLQTHVGTLNISSKQAYYKYDRGVSVTKQELDLFHLLSLEQEDQMYPPPLDVKNEQEDEDEDETEKTDDVQNQLKLKVKYLSEDQQEKITDSNNFKKFMRRKSVEMNSQLEETKVLIQDLLENENPEGAQDLRERLTPKYKFEGYGIQKAKEETGKEGKALEQISYKPSHDLWSVVDVSWCRVKAEWFLAIYRRNQDRQSKSTEEEEGRIVIWEMNSKNSKDTKECVKVLSCTKPVNRAIFAPNDENYVYGALSSGQVAVWDIRLKSKPVLQSKPSLNNHNLPIYCVENVFDGRRDLLMTVSNEGKLSVWNPEALSDPELIETLTFKQDKNSTTQKAEKEYEDIPLAPIASCVFRGAGAKDAKIYLATLDKLVQGYSVNELLSKTENKTTTRLNGHDAPISCIAVNNQEQSSTFGCVLTGSFDFSICLWKPNASSEPVVTYEIHDDYITGLDWNPNHPAMFVSSDCNGTIALWNLLEDKDYPVYVTRTDPISSTKWHPDGLKLIVATLNGNVELWEIKKRFMKYSDESKAEFEVYFDRL